jgi:hypothetical protein
MANLTITAASVLADSASNRETGVAGEAVTAGQAVYLASATRKWMLADADSGTAEARKATGIALNGAALNQPLAVLKSGDVTIGATLTPGTAYYLSDDPGGICPLADVSGGDYICLIGLAKTAAVLTVAIQYPNVAT